MILNNEFTPGAQQPALTIFVTNHKTAGYVWYGKVKMYTFEIYENGVLIQNLIPCYRKSNNEIGMYDVVGQQLYTNAGTGVFIAGPDVN